VSPNYVKGHGPFDAKVMIIGEAPGRNEDEQGIPLVGPTGLLAQELVAEAGGKWSEVYKTNVVKYQPPYNDMTKLHLIGVDLKESIEKLWREEIDLIKPTVIIAMGDYALNAVCELDGIMNWRGSILLAKDGKTKVIPTIHPAALFPRKGDDKGMLSWVWRKIIAHDINRAFEQSQFKDYRIPLRQTDIARNSLDVFRFFQEYQKLDRSSCDIESINCVPVCVGFSFNKFHSITIPLISRVGSVPLTDMSRRELVECWKLIQQEVPRLKLVGQNFKYDEYKLRLLGFNGFKLYSDTLLKAHTIFPELPNKGLHVLSSLWTEEPYYKEEGKEPKIGKHFSATKFFRYCGKDCCVELEVDEAQEESLIQMEETFKVPLRDLYYNYVMKKHPLYLDMENRGFNIDLPKKKFLAAKYDEMAEQVHIRLEAAVGYDVNVRSPQQVFELLYQAMKFKPFKKAPTGEDAIVALIANHCKGAKGAEYKKVLEDVLEERRIRNIKSKSISFSPDFDDKCKTSFKIEATETCRSSTNILKKPVRPKKIGLAFHTIPKHGRLAKDIRSMFIPTKGKIFLQADSSQAEARVVAVLAEDYELLKAFDTIDIHRRTASLFFGFTQSLILETIDIGAGDRLPKEGPERFTGKMFRHAGNYDMGKRRAMMEFNTNAQKYDIDMRVSEWKAGHFIDLFHSASPRIRGVFHRDIREALQNTRTIIDPFGFPRIFHGRMDDELFKEGYANIPQRTVAHLVQQAALEVYKEIGSNSEAFFVAENHDALVLEVPENNWEPYAKLLKKHMTKPIDFSTYCTLKRDFVLTIPCDIEIGVNNYGEMEKVKL